MGRLALILAAAIVALCAGARAEVNSLAVVKISSDAQADGKVLGCSATIVDPSGLIISAEHCQCSLMTTATLRDGREVRVEQLYEPPTKQGRDEVAVLRIIDTAPAEGWPFIPVSSGPAPVGAEVAAYGYPTAHGWVEADPGRVIAATERLIWLDGIERGGPGMSGGPLLFDGSIVGVCSGKGGADQVGGVSVNGGSDEATMAPRWIAWAEIRKSIDSATSAMWSRSRRVVIFTSTACVPCQRLKADIAAGHFDRYDLVQHVYDSRSRTWRTDEGRVAYETFHAAAKPGEPFFPIIWVEGTSDFREGYAPTQRGGLIGFLDGVLRGIGRLIVGEEPRARAPIPGRVPAADPAPSPKAAPPVEPVIATPPGYDELRTSVAEVVDDIKALKDGSLFEKLAAVKSIRGDLAAVKEYAESAKLEATQAGDDVAKLGGLGVQLTEIKADVDTLRNGNPLEKIKALTSLKSEVGELKDKAADLREDVDGDPFRLLYTVGFWLTGLLHRRFAA